MEGLVWGADRMSLATLKKGTSASLTTTLLRTLFIAHGYFEDAMRRDLFLRVHAGIREQDPWLAQKTDAHGKNGMHPLQKAVAAFRILAYGCSYDMVDEYVRVSESSASDCLEHFCSAVEAKFGPEHLHSPTTDDLKRIQKENASRGFPGMISSLDCMNWKWENCPKAWHGSYRGVKGTSIVLEAAVSYDLWFWHSFFGMTGSLNDINVLSVLRFYIAS